MENPLDIRKISLYIKDVETKDSTMKHKKLSKDELYKKSKYYAVKRDDMEVLSLCLGVIGYLLVSPAAIVMYIAGIPESSIKDWQWAPMAPSLICGWIGLYFHFRSWLADPYKNI